MKILLAPDKFKGSLSAVEVCDAMKNPVKNLYPDWEVIAFPLADGGEGSAEIFKHYSEGKELEIPCLDPLFRPIKSTYIVSKDGKTAFIEMAKASGLELLKETERNCLNTTSFGTGELLKDAISQGVEKIILSIGGSATCDGGIGMAAGLGYNFLDEKGRELRPIGASLNKIKTIKAPKDLDYMPRCYVACDVNNPLFGAEGAAYIYGPQKGASPEECLELDQGLMHFSKIVREQMGHELDQLPGAGAAGGLGAGAVAFLEAELKPGIELIMEYSGFLKALEGVDLVLTGEGKIDKQTLHGKVVKGVAEKASTHGIPVFAFCGTLEADRSVIDALKLNYATSIINRPMSLPEAQKNAKKLLEASVYEAIKLYSLK